MPDEATPAPEQEQQTAMAIEAPASETIESKFIDWLAQHRNGVLDVDLREAVEEVIHAVQTTGKAGSVILTLKIEPQKGGMFAVSDTVVAKPPVIPDAKLYYVDADGSFTRDNPLQPKLLIPPSASESGD